MASQNCYITFCTSENIIEIVCHHKNNINGNRFAEPKALGLWCDRPSVYTQLASENYAKSLLCEIIYSHFPMPSLGDCARGEVGDIGYDFVPTLASARLKQFYLFHRFFLLSQTHNDEHAHVRPGRLTQFAHPHMRIYTCPGTCVYAGASSSSYLRLILIKFRRCLRDKSFYV